MLGADFRRGLALVLYDGEHGVGPAADEGLQGALQDGPEGGDHDGGEVRIREVDAGRGAGAFPEGGEEERRGLGGEEARCAEERDAGDAGRYEGYGAWEKG